jgi:hypothetical protein
LHVLARVIGDAFHDFCISEVLRVKYPETKIRATSIKPFDLLHLIGQEWLTPEQLEVAILSMLV